MKPILFILSLFSAATVYAGSCQPGLNSCGFYQCEEDRHQCGPKGYLLDFGFKYCQEFLQRNAEFSPPAQSFLRNVRLCLMTELEKLDQGLSCQQLETAALTSHVGCYTQSGFCELNGVEKIKILWLLRKSSLSEEVRENALILDRACFEKDHPTSDESDRIQP